MITITCFEMHPPSQLQWNPSKKERGHPLIRTLLTDILPQGMETAHASHTIFVCVNWCKSFEVSGREVI